MEKIQKIQNKLQKIIEEIEIYEDKLANIQFLEVHPCTPGILDFKIKILEKRKTDFEYELHKQKLIYHIENKYQNRGY